MLKTITIFMSYGGSLYSWKVLVFWKENLKFLKNFQTMDIKLILFLWKNNDLEIAKKFNFDNVYVNKTFFHPFFYSFLIPFIYSKIIKNSSVLRTNQIIGSHTAFLSKIIWKKPYIVRVGYSLSKNTKKEKGAYSLYSILSKLYEFFFLKHADLCFVSNTKIMNLLIKSYKLEKKKCKLVPNYVIKKNWTPSYNVKSKNTRFIYFGRLSPEKNIKNFIIACKNLHVDVTIIGQGNQLDDLKRTSKINNVKTLFIETVPQKKLKKFLNVNDFFFLPSIYEGTPKSLIESLAYGIPSIVNEFDGIHDIVNKNLVVMCQSSVQSIRSKIKECLKMKKSKKLSYSKLSRKFILEKYEVEKIHKIELKNLKEIFINE